MAAKASFGATLGGLIGAAAGAYIGIPLLLPLTGAFMTGFAIHRLGGGMASRPYAAAVALQAGHLSWMILGAALGSLWADVAIDLVVMGAGLVWLYLRPGFAPAAVLCVWHALGLLVNLWTLSDLGFGADVHKSLLSHILLRGSAIGLMVAAFRTSRSAQAAGAASPRGEAGR